MIIRASFSNFLKHEVFLILLTTSGYQIVIFPNNNSKAQAEIATESSRQATSINDGRSGRTDGGKQ